MSVRILFVLALAMGLTNAAVAREEPELKDGVEVDSYDCKGKEIGNYEHPTQCTKDIACASGNRGFEMPCAVCNYNEVTCPDGILHYKEAQDKCQYVDQAGCTAGGNKPTTTTTTEEPITTKRPEIPIPDPDGDCVPDECKLKDWCHWYQYCERVHQEDGHKGEGKEGFRNNGTGKEEHNLYFNRDRNTEHGGVCDFFGNLSDEKKHAYNTDPDCIEPHYEWNVDPKNPVCADMYLYFHTRENDGEILTLTYPPGLLWSQPEKNCLHCSDVFDDDGKYCCPEE